MTLIKAIKMKKMRVYSTGETKDFFSIRKKKVVGNVEIIAEDKARKC